MNALQSFVAATRLRFGVALAALCVLAFLSFSGWLRLCANMHWGISARLAGFGLIAAIVVGFYALRLRVLRHSPLWALVALIPVGNIILPIYLIVKESNLISETET
jgi:hypothetical protein